MAQASRAPGDREWTKGFDAPVPRWVEPLAWGSNGALYSLWTNLRPVDGAIARQGRDLEDLASA